jgi:hypothetical protein
MSIFKHRSWLLSVCLASAPAFAADTVIDFEDSTGTTASFDSRGYRFTTSDATVLGITPDYQIWALSGYYSFNMFQTNTDPFTLKQMSIRLIGNQPVYAVGGITFRGKIDGGGYIYQTASLVTYASNFEGIAIPGELTVDFDSSWTNLTNVEVFLVAHTNSLTGFFFDDIVVAPAGVLPAEIDIDTAAPNRAVHPDHDGSASAPGGLNDVIEVIVFTSTTSAGDPVNLVAGNIVGSTLSFGPAGAGLDPSSTTELNTDFDNDGFLDAKFHFLTGDTGVACADTELTLTGETNSGAQFAGTDSAFDSECDAECH